jgi:hypothetical protein
MSQQPPPRRSGPSQVTFFGMVSGLGAIMLLVVLGQLLGLLSYAQMMSGIGLVGLFMISLFVRDRFQRVRRNNTRR